MGGGQEVAPRTSHIPAHLGEHPALDFAGLHRHEQLIDRGLSIGHAARSLPRIVNQSVHTHPTFLIASRSTLRPSAMSAVGAFGFISYSRLMQPWKPTSFSALTTPGTSSAPRPTITSTLRPM